MVWGMGHKCNQQLCFANRYIVLMLVHGLLTICPQLLCLHFSSFLSFFFFLRKEIFFRRMMLIDSLSKIPEINLKWIIKFSKYVQKFL